MKEKKNTLDHDIDALFKSHFEKEIGAIEDKSFPAGLRKSKPKVGTRSTAEPAPETVSAAGTRREAAGQTGPAAGARRGAPDLTVPGRTQGGAYSGHSEHRLRDILFKAAGIALIIILPSLAVIKRHEEPPLSRPIAEVWKSRELGTKVISGLSRLQNSYSNTQKLRSDK